MSSKNNFINLRLGFFSEYAQGQPVWLPRGKIFLENLKSFVRGNLVKAGYEEVETPTICSNRLWEKTGHMDKFKDNMFILDDSALKPMNCPLHSQAFKIEYQFKNKLPIKFFEFSSCFRNEKTGALNGLFRLLKFTQDDSHAFCNLEHIEEIISDFIDMLNDIYAICKMKLCMVTISSTKDENYVGDKEKNELAKRTLVDICKKKEIKIEEAEGEGAFYGPKIDFYVQDSSERKWQCGTVQLDFCLPKRLDLQCEAVVHHAHLGTFERFIGVILDSDDFKMPLILNPFKIGVVSVGNGENARNHWLKLRERMMIECLAKPEEIKENFSNKDLSEKIKHYSNLMPGMIIVIGPKEISSGTVSLSNESLDFEAFIRKYKEVLYGQVRRKI